MKTILMILGCLVGWHLFSSSPEIVVNGFVTDSSTGKPLVDARVSVRGTSIEVWTGTDGFYEVRTTKNKITIAFSKPGYEKQSISIDSSQTVNLALKPVSEQEEPTTISNDPSVRFMEKISGRVMASDAAPAPVPYHSYYSNREEQNWNTEDYDLIQENGFVSTDEQQMSTFSIDVDRASYSNIRRFITQGTTAPVDAVRIEEMINYFHYQYPEPAGHDPVSIHTELGSCPWNPDHHLLHIGLQTEKIATENLPASNLVFLIDVSGSMNQANKLPLLIASFRLLVDQLRPYDHVSIVTYAGQSAVILDGTTGGDKERILDALNRLQAGGSTDGAQGILTAYELAERNFIKDGNNRVILATDGDFNIGMSSDAELVRLIEKQRASNIFLSVLGFGMGNYKDNKMQKLADSGNGNHQYIDDLAEAKKVFVEEFGGNLFTVAKDVKIQIEFNPEMVAGYRLIGYENRKLENRDFNDDAKDAGEIGAGHTVTALFEVIPQGVESPWLATVEKRYTTSRDRRTSSRDGELAFVKLRYKDPDGEHSKLIERPVEAGVISITKLSDDFRWAASVAGFGMLLRDSEFKGHTSFEMVMDLAEKGRGDDPHGYRSDFIDLLTKANRVYLFSEENDQVKMNDK